MVKNWVLTARYTRRSAPVRAMGRRQTFSESKSCTMLAMPKRWLHESLDLVIWGHSYWRIHRGKDSASEALGQRHRAVGHPWYSRYGLEWSMEDPFPVTSIGMDAKNPGD
jgi:hypothetical protein